MEARYFIITIVLALSIIGCVLVSAYVFAFSRLQKSNYIHMLLQSFSIFWMIFRLCETFAPTTEKRLGMEILQYFIVGISFLLWGSACIVAKKRAGFTTCLFGALLFSGLAGFDAFNNLNHYKDSLTYFAIPIIAALLTGAYSFWMARYDFNKKTDISLKNVMDNIGECVLVLDSKKLIMDGNLSFFKRYFKIHPPEDYAEFVEQLHENLSENDGSYEALVELGDGSAQTIRFSMVDLTEVYYYSAKKAPLLDGEGHQIGEIISFHDLTGHYKLLEELEDKKAELLRNQEELRDYLLVVSELEEAKEKKEILLKIQNSLGQEIMELLSVLEVARIKASENDHSEKELKIAIEACRNVIGEIRNSVTVLMPSGKGESNDKNNYY